MKISRPFLLVLALTATRLAGSTPVMPPLNAEPIVIIQTEPADFPLELSNLGVIDGWAKVVVGIDEQGLLLDALAIGYSHPRFAESALAALARWQYQPARVGGRPITAVTQLDFTYRYDSAGAKVVTITALTYSEQLKLRSHRAENRLCRLEELDTTPIPTHLISPAYSEYDIHRNAGKTVVVSFYIDETGRVRLPTINYADDDAVARQALAAVAQWRFEPPKARQQPVITKASQAFVFKAPAR